jgi:acid phosphatase type 7
MRAMDLDRRVSRWCWPVLLGGASVVLALAPNAVAATSLSFSPIADAYVSEASPTANFGTATQISLQSAPALTGYIIFNPGGLPGSVTSATLRVQARTTSSHGFDVRALADTTWSEQTLAYENAPAPDPMIAASSGAFSSGQWISIDVTQLVEGNGPVGIALTRTRTTSVSVSSKEAGAAAAPQLTVTTTGTLAPVNTSPPSISGSAQAGRMLAAQPGGWSGTDPISYEYAWQRCDTTASACTDIAGAIGPGYTVGEDDVGSTLRVVVTASNEAGSVPASSNPTLGVLSADAYPVIVAAGDIACDPATPEFNAGLGTTNACRQLATSDLFMGGSISAVLPLGDAQYECGGPAAWQQSYAPSWGRLKAITRPVPGNHEYQTSGATDCSAENAGAAGYFGYFGALAGEPGKGYYSYDVGAWHLVALNSNCGRIGGCGAGSAQEQWLRQDLAASTARCTLAYWHHPLFSSGAHRPGETSVRPLFQALYDHGAEVLLIGHDHNYERFAPQSPSGTLDLARGVRQFIVGTGGRSLYAQGVPIANSEARNSRSFGVLELTLRPSSYDWRFLSATNTGFEDAQSQACDSPPHDTSRPEAPTGLSATVTSGTQVDLNWMEARDGLGATRYEIYRDGSLLASTTSAVTTYTDTTANPSTTHSYEIRARDAAGNLSFASNPSTATTPPPSTVAFDAEADARVEEGHPETNYGGSNLRVDGGADPDVESYLRFNLNGLETTIQSAKLRVYAYSGTGDGPAVSGSEVGWAEPGITWANRSPAVTVPVDDKGQIAANSWVEYDVTPLVNGPGSYSFVLTTSSTDGVDLHSREAANRPRLIVTTG